ncbi:ornithine carbamoyltransferase [Leuconostocaceae bacterium ESL0723]|nr:ornithine carbamoyltransferase [Leuconostocaceae bacterium ESL0723]
MVSKAAVAALQGRSYLKEVDFSPTELKTLVDLAAELKAAKKASGKVPKYLHDKNLILLFAKTSTRTRLSFEIGGDELGANTVYIDPSASQFGQKESVADTAHVFAGMADAIEYRGYSQDDMESMAANAVNNEGHRIPVWNGLSDQWHPTQMIADFLTIQEEFGKIDNQVTLAFVGDGRNNMANSLLVTGAMLGINVNIVAPKSLQPAPDVVGIAERYARMSGSQLLITDDVAAGVADANVIYSDVFVSMGEHNWAERLQLLKPYQVNQEVLKLSKHYGKDLITLHCLPAFHDLKTTVAQELHEKYPDLVGTDGIEVTNQVFNGPQARHFVEAENRKHAIMAIMVATLGDLSLMA